MSYVTIEILFNQLKYVDRIVQCLELLPRIRICKKVAMSVGCEEVHMDVVSDAKTARLGSYPALSHLRKTTLWLYGDWID